MKGGADQENAGLDLANIIENELQMKCNTLEVKVGPFPSPTWLFLE